MTRRAQRLRTPAEVAGYLRTDPPLAEVAERFPQEWDAARREFAALMESSDATGLGSALAASSGPPPELRAGRGHARPQQEVVADTVRRHVLHRMLRQALVAAGTGVSGGRIRFGLVNGWVLQRLLFERGLRRKPVPYRAFRLAWPLLRQRRLLMPLVAPHGVYCFYSRPLVAGIAKVVDGRSCVEIAAGDGTLSRFLRDAGVDVVATDDHSWARRVGYDTADVEKLDAVAALRAHRPRVVVCSWPPPGNAFEAKVFTTPSVELYVLVTSRHEFAAGDWNAYREQDAFSFEEAPHLSRLIVPPEIDGAVYLFRRRGPAGE